MGFILGEYKEFCVVLRGTSMSGEPKMGSQPKIHTIVGLTSDERGT